MPPLGKNYRLTIPVPTGVPTRPEAASEVTKKLDQFWSKKANAKQGAALDKTLTNLGKPSREGGRVKWEPPPDLSPAYAAYLSASVAELNRLIEEGVMEIDADGNIKPVNA